MHAIDWDMLLEIVRMYVFWTSNDLQTPTPQKTTQKNPTQQQPPKNYNPPPNPPNP